MAREIGFAEIELPLEPASCGVFEAPVPVKLIDSAPFCRNQQ
jgi:hypothetical protein